jgi:hypothetical protein
MLCVFAIAEDHEGGGSETIVYASLAAGTAIVVLVCAVFCYLDRQVTECNLARYCSRMPTGVSFSHNMRQVCLLYTVSGCIRIVIMSAPSVRAASAHPAETVLTASVQKLRRNYEAGLAGGSRGVDTDNGSRPGTEDSRINDVATHPTKVRAMVMKVGVRCQHSGLYFQTSWKQPKCERHVNCIRVRGLVSVRRECRPSARRSHHMILAMTGWSPLFLAALL